VGGVRSREGDRAATAWRHFFLIQPDLPERLIGADPRFYLRRTFDEWAGQPSPLTPGALAEERPHETAAALQEVLSERGA
jgi:hypothetical protein